MFATAKKFVILPTMIGFAAAVATITPAIAETAEDMEMSTETPAVNCLPLELQRTGTCIPLPSMPIRRTVAPGNEMTSVSNNASTMDAEDESTNDATTFASNNETSTSAVETTSQPTQLSSIEALNTPEALSRIPRLPRITSNIAEVPEDAVSNPELIAQDID